MKAREEKQTGLQAYSSIGHSLTLTTRLIGNIVDEVQLMSSGYKHCIERIHQPPQFREGGEEFSYHFCYYAPSENGRRVFGQHGRLFPQRELRELLRPCPRERRADLFHDALRATQPPIAPGIQQSCTAMQNPRPILAKFAPEANLPNIFGGKTRERCR